jgi:hypothetical protein
METMSDENTAPVELVLSGKRFLRQDQWSRQRGIHPRTTARHRERGLPWLDWAGAIYIPEDEGDAYITGLVRGRIRGRRRSAALWWWSVALAGSQGAAGKGRKSRMRGVFQMENPACLYSPQPRLSIAGNGHRFVPRPVGNGHRFVPRPITAFPSREHIAAIDGRADKNKTPSQKAVLAGDVRRGAILIRPTLEALATVLGVSREYIRQAAKLDVADQAEVRAGSMTLQQAKAGLLGS